MSAIKQDINEALNDVMSLKNLVVENWDDILETAAQIDKLLREGLIWLEDESNIKKAMGALKTDLPEIDFENPIPEGLLEDALKPIQEQLGKLDFSKDFNPVDLIDMVKDQFKDFDVPGIPGFDLDILKRIIELLKDGGLELSLRDLEDKTGGSPEQLGKGTLYDQTAMPSGDSSSPHPNERTDQFWNNLEDVVSAQLDVGLKSLAGSLDNAFKQTFKDFSVKDNDLVQRLKDLWDDQRLEGKEVDFTKLLQEARPICIEVLKQSLGHQPSDKLAAFSALAVQLLRSFADTDLKLPDQFTPLLKWFDPSKDSLSSISLLSLFVSIPSTLFEKISGVKIQFKSILQSQINSGELAWDGGLHFIKLAKHLFGWFFSKSHPKLIFCSDVMMTSIVISLQIMSYKSEYEKGSEEEKTVWVLRWFLFPLNQLVQNGLKIIYHFRERTNENKPEKEIRQQLENIIEEFETRINKAQTELAKSNLNIADSPDSWVGSEEFENSKTKANRFLEAFRLIRPYLLKSDATKEEEDYLQRVLKLCNKYTKPVENWLTHATPIIEEIQKIPETQIKMKKIRASFETLKASYNSNRPFSNSSISRITECLDEMSNFLGVDSNILSYKRLSPKEIQSVFFKPESKEFEAKRNFKLPNSLIEQSQNKEMLLRALDALQCCKILNLVALKTRTDIECIETSLGILRSNVNGEKEVITSTSTDLRRLKERKWQADIIDTGFPMVEIGVSVLGMSYALKGYVPDSTEKDKLTNWLFASDLGVLSASVISALIDLRSYRRPETTGGLVTTGKAITAVTRTLAIMLNLHFAAEKANEERRKGK